MTDTPLGRSLIETGAVGAECLRSLKSSPLVRRRDSTLIYLPTAARGMTVGQVGELVKDFVTVTLERKDMTSSGSMSFRSRRP